ncbi:tRNA lysidine(34) synthetase TilS [Psychroflexus sp. YR1-1]|uniref:tRNA(Ile)-lysidine synthase n=1 Tax=Psychroflexus aurantiacus TaxID=2709310 RepID=A0A6B3R3K6_9FLAO|nr:tRNA lysidine(34) synthetase TilS [Psychroflexus aurantiacus]NEV94130.1 tRNA lysidine(34) synthetase TilS [Psychroflexus aurantiacus]
MQNRFQTHIESEFPELLKQPFIIAMSGGIDSVVLVHLCLHLKLDFALAHCNFQLRAEASDTDERFVEDLANSMNCPFFVKKFKTETLAEEQKESIQITARNMRYAWFRELIETTAYPYLLTAHHLNDSLETFIINLNRSTGLKGLTGIPDRNDYIRRPLLIFSKDDIYSYARENNIDWREDQSNATTKYLRNKIRHQVVPSLMDLNSQFLNNFKSSLEKLKDAELLIEDYTTLLFKTLVTKKDEHYEIDIEKLNTFPNQKAILYQLLVNFGFTEWEDVYHLLEAQTGKQVKSSSHLLVKDRGKLVLSTISIQRFEPVKIDEDQNNIDLNGFTLKFKKVEKLGNFRSNVAYIDKSKLKFPLSVRSVRNGDYFYPFGMQGKKKLSDFLKDEKISPHLKSSQLLLCNGNADVIWVLNLRTDDRYKVEPTTEDILKIEILND